jgi:hypothetical protein
MIRCTASTMPVTIKILYHFLQYHYFAFDTIAVYRTYRDPFDNSFSIFLKMTQATDLKDLVMSSVSSPELNQVLANLTKGHAEGVQDEETVCCRYHTYIW